MNCLKRCYKGEGEKGNNLLLDWNVKRIMFLEKLVERDLSFGIEFVIFGYGIKDRHWF